MILTALTPLEAWRMMPEQCRTREMLSSLETLSYPLVIRVEDAPPAKGAVA